MALKCLLNRLIFLSFCVMAWKCTEGSLNLWTTPMNMVKQLRFWKKQKKTDSHTNFHFDLQLLNRRSKSKPEEWVHLEYTSLFEKYTSLSSSLCTIFFNWARWLFYWNLFPILVLKQGKQRFDHRFLDECISDLVQAQLDVHQWTLQKGFQRKLLSVLEQRKSERPEYVAWFKSNFCSNQIKEPDEIIQLYESVLGIDGLSIFLPKTPRKFSSPKLNVQESRFGTLSPGSFWWKSRKKIVQSVLEHPDHSLDELRECLEIRDGDVIETIPSILEAEKRRCQRRAFES